MNGLASTWLWELQSFFPHQRCSLLLNRLFYFHSKNLSNGKFWILWWDYFLPWFSAWRADFESAEVLASWLLHIWGWHCSFVGHRLEFYIHLQLNFFGSPIYLWDNSFSKSRFFWHSWAVLIKIDPDIQTFSPVSTVWKTFLKVSTESFLLL